MRKGILAFADDHHGRSVCLWEDNQAVVHIIRNSTSRSHESPGPLLMAELCLLLELLDNLDICLVLHYIKSELNVADEFSRLTDRDAWSLKPHVQRMLTPGGSAPSASSIALAFLSTLSPAISPRSHLAMSRGSLTRQPCLSMDSRSTGSRKRPFESTHCRR